MIIAVQLQLMSGAETAAQASLLEFHVLEEAIVHELRADCGTKEKQGYSLLAGETYMI